MTRLAAITSFLCRNALWILFLVGCDTYDGDEIDSKKEVTFTDSDFYVLPRSSIVIDLRSVIEQSFVGGSLAVSRHPARGKLTQLDPYLLKYSPDQKFVEGEDKFSISILIDKSSSIKTKTMKIIMENSISAFPCAVYAIEDHGRARPNQITTVDPMRNDRVCGVDGQLKVSLHIMPNAGEAEVVGDSIVYRPGPTFKGVDELVYKLSNDNDEDVAFGIVTFEDMRIETVSLASRFDNMFFLNEKVGFVAGGVDIMKTVDGGTHWELLNYAGKADLQSVYISDLFFLDERTGFVALSAIYDACWGGPYTVGWMTTEDGGDSWKLTTLDQGVESIFFTSPSTGFMSTPSSGTEVQKILRTLDGGETWEEVAACKAHGALKIRFSNGQNGYAYGSDKIFATTDGGKSWMQAISNERIGSVAVMDANAICASISVTELNPTYLPRPGTIARCEDGTTWTNVVSFPFAIVQIGFSPSADLGVAVGVTRMDPVPALHNLTINLSTDKGKTWTNLSKDVQGIPLAISVPSANVAYVLCSDRILKVIP